MVNLHTEVLRQLANQIRNPWHFTIGSAKLYSSGHSRAQWMRQRGRMEDMGEYLYEVLGVDENEVESDAVSVL